MSVINGNSSELIVKNGLILNLDAGNRKSYISGSTNWNDLAGTASAILVNGPLYTGSNGGGLVFDGTNDYAIVSSSNFQSGNNPFTMEAWFKLNNTPAWNIIFAYGQDTGGQAKAAILYIDTSLQPVFEFGSSSGKVTGSIIQLNQWYHVVGTYDKSYTRMYLNGTLLNSTSFSSANVSLDNGVNGQNAGIGCFFSGFGNVTSPQRYGSFNGTIPIARHYNRALSASEVLQNYNANKSRFASSLSISNVPRVPTNGLILSLDAANVKSYVSGSNTIYDLSGNNFTGSLINGPTYTNTNKGSIVFDGINDYIEISSSMSAVQVTDNPGFSITGWFFATINDGTWRAIISKAEAAFGGDRQYIIVLSAGYKAPIRTLAFFSNGVGSGAIWTNNEIKTNTWYYFAAIHYPSQNSSLNSFYVREVNGPIEPTTRDGGDAAINPDSSTAPIYIGRYRSEQLFSWGGRISDIKYYNRVLSTTEITGIYNATKGRYGL